MFFAYEVPIEKLREFLNYNARTGVITWRKKPARRILVGSVAGTPKGPDDYLIFQFDGTLYRAHRVVWAHYYGAWPSREVDHKNLRRQDNRIKNLRLAERSTNCANGPGHIEGHLKGTSTRKDGKWTAQIGVNRKKVHLGSFATAEEAHEAYCRAAERYFGEFARFK